MTAKLRIWAPIVAVALVLAAAYLVAGLAGNASSNASDIEGEPTLVASTETPPSGASPTAARTSAPRATAARTSGPATASASATPEPGRYDLRSDERKGGHTIERHVGQTDAQLADRLRRERSISAASSYFDLETAERVVYQAFVENKNEVDAWVRRSGDRPNLVLDIDLKEAVGRSMRRGGQPKDVDSALVVVKWDGRDYFVLTSYPQE